MNKGDTVYSYEIEFSGKKARINRTVEQYNIIGYNDNYLCVDDFRFSSIKHTKVYSGDNDTLFNHTGIIDWLNTSYLEKIIAFLYTSESDSNIAFKRLEKAIEKHCTKKYGIYCSVVQALKENPLTAATEQGQTKNI